jgi:hypothetical protein
VLGVERSEPRHRGGNEVHPFPPFARDDAGSDGGTELHRTDCYVQARVEASGVHFSECFLNGSEYLYLIWLDVRLLQIQICDCKANLATGNTPPQSETVSLHFTKYTHY